MCLWSENYRKMDDGSSGSLEAVVYVCKKFEDKRFVAIPCDCDRLNDSALFILSHAYMHILLAKTIHNVLLVSLGTYKVHMHVAGNNGSIGTSVATL